MDRPPNVNSPATHLAAGPIAAVVDRVRDAIRDAGGAANLTIVVTLEQP